MTVAVFELGGALAPALPDLELGPWTRMPPGIAAFDAGAGPPESLWRVELVRDDAANRVALAGGERSVARTHAVLDEVPRRLEQALAELARQGPPARAPARLEQALQRIGDFARGRARIETRIAGVLVACSVMTLSGNTELWITPGLPPAVAGLHARSVAVAVRTRHAWARILALIVAGCGRVAALGLPLAGVAALPLVWGLLRDVLREVRDLDAGRRGNAPAVAP